MEHAVLAAHQARFRGGLLILVLMVWALTALGCDQSADVREISLQQSERIKTPPSATKRQESLQIAIAAMISPRETLDFYKEILAYLSQKMSLPVQLVQRETYEEINELLREKELHAAFVCTGAYVNGHDNFGMELLVAPVAYGKSVYYSYIIVPRDSAAASIKDLRGKTFAFTDPLSNTGRLSPTYMLARLGEDVESFFSKAVFTYSHDKSIRAVAEKLVDGAAVDSLIWDYMQATEPGLTAGTKIISRSPPYGIPPVVVPHGLDNQLKEDLRTVFLQMHEDEQGRALLEKIRIDRFIEVSDAIYDSTRTMQQWLANEK